MRMGGLLKSSCRQSGASRLLLTSSFRDAPLGAGPESITPRSWLWIPGSRFARPGTTKKAGIAPGLLLRVATASVQRGALRRRGRPRLDQGVVVDGFTLRLLVRQLALGRDVAFLGGLAEPVLGRLLLVELRSAGALDAGFLQTFHHRILGCGERVHRRLWRLGPGRRIADVLPPQLRQLRIVGHVVAGRGPLHARRRAVELDQPAEFRRALGERLVPDIGLTDEGETDMALLQGHRLGDDELQIEPGRLAAVGRRRLQQRRRTDVPITWLPSVLPVRAW